MNIVFNKKRNIIVSWWRSLDHLNYFAFLILGVISLILVTTASPAIAARVGLVETYFIKKQIIYILTAYLIITFLTFASEQQIKKISLLGFLLSLALMLIVKFYGYEVKGAKRWISLAGMSLQPSEFMKVFFTVISAWLLSIYHQNKEFLTIQITFLLYLIVAALLLLQPDFGMFVTISAIWGVQLVVAGMPLILMLIGIILGGFAVSGAYIFLPHVAARVNKFLDKDLQENYQVMKSLKALEYGGLYGKGPGEGVIKQYIPDCHCDFIFAVAAEEFGSLISVAIILIYALIVIRTILNLFSERSYFVIFAVSGLVSQIAIQSIINIGVNLNLLPTKGMTLPFVSYGGSSTIAVAITMGIILSLTKTKIDVNSYKLKNIEITI